MKKDTSNFVYLKASAILGALTMFLLFFISLPNIAGMLGLSTSAAGTVYKIFNTYSNVAMAVSVVAAVTGVGTIGASVTAAILYAIKKKAKSAAIAF